MFGLFFTDAGRIVNFAEAGRCNVGAFKAFFHLMLERGVYLAPSAFEAGFVSSAHTEEHIHATVAAARESFARL
jgi:glutamate-1-semialdehyde 2,1-aminomutase